MRNFNRVFLSLSLLLGTVFAGAVLPTQAGAVGFAPTATDLQNQVYTKTDHASNFDLSVTWTNSVPDGNGGIFYIQVDTNPSPSITTWSAETATVLGTCVTAGNYCNLTGSAYPGVPNAYPIDATDARYRITLRLATYNYFSGFETLDFIDSLHQTDTYVSIDDSATVYGDRVQIAGFVLAETETVGVNSGTIYFYDEGPGKFTDFAAGESVTVSNRSDTSTAIGSCNPHTGPNVNDGGELTQVLTHTIGVADVQLLSLQ